MFRRKPQVPQGRISGPTDDQIAQQEASLKQYEQQITQQQAQFTTQLQQQIDEPRRTKKLQAAFAEEQANWEQELADANAAAAGAGAAEANNAYAVTATQTEAPAGQTTQAITEEEEQEFAQDRLGGTTESTAGTGLNIGV